MIESVNQKGLRKKYDTVIFDLDGTLLYTLEALADCVNYAMKKYGYEEKKLDTVRKCVGNGMRVLLKKSLPDDIDEKRFEEIFCDFKKYYIENCTKRTKPYDGIIELLDRLKEYGYKTAIVSNKNDVSVEKLKKMFFENNIDVAIGENPKINRKPAPDSVYKAITDMDSELRKTIYIGDSEVDYMTAKNAGIDCILVSWGFRSKEDLLKCEGTIVVDSTEEILDMLL